MFDFSVLDLLLFVFFNFILHMLPPIPSHIISNTFTAERLKQYFRPVRQGGDGISIDPALALLLGCLYGLNCNLLHYYLSS
ncbi:hypothetical protein FKM82_013142 [Ascaphus truei]